MKVLRVADYRHMPWANGKGVTVELAKADGEQSVSFAGRFALAPLTKGDFSGGTSGLHLSNEMRELMTKAEDEQKKLKDDFLSVEHIILALVKTKTELSDVLKQAGLTYDTVLKALTAVRGSQRVVDQDPEGKYQTLEK